MYGSAIGAPWCGAFLDFVRPVARLEELVVEARLRRARLGMPIVAPADEGRERHEDRFRAAAGLETEERAAVPDQIELHVAAAAVELEIALALAVRHVFAAPQDRQVGGQEMIADAPQQREAALESPLVQIVEED